MKKVLILTVFSLLTCVVNAQPYQEIISKAHTCLHIKDYSNAFKYFQKAFKIESNNYLDQYAAACAASAAGKKDNALVWLRRSINSEGIGIAHTFMPGDFVALHGSPVYKALVEKLERKIDSSNVVYDLSLKKELNRIHDEDQNIRRLYIEAEQARKKVEVDSLLGLMKVSDSLNLEKVCKILDSKGWVGRSIVGDRGNMTLFLVIQHADLLTQQRYLPMARRAVSVKNAHPGELAYLEDRIALREGRKQIYGSQVGTDPETFKYYVMPLEDPDNVDERRKRVGLERLSEYLKHYNTAWEPEAYKKELPKLMKLNRMKD